MKRTKINNRIKAVERIYSYYLLWCLLFMGTPLYGQQSISSARNAVRITTPRQAITDPALINKENSMVTVQYTDGLGRSTVSVVKDFSPQGKDLVSMQSFDARGKAQESWLPVPVQRQDTPYDPEQIMQQARSFYSDTHPYSKMEHDIDFSYREDSLTRPGSLLHTKGKKRTSRIEANAQQVYIEMKDTIVVPEHLQVDKYTISSTRVERIGTYPAFALQAHTKTDEDGRTRIDFFDATGKLILERQIYDKQERIYYDTYYIYNEKGLLACVLPPEASKRIAAAPRPQGFLSFEPSAVNQYAYLYYYDNRGRCIKKKLPGTEPYYYVYDSSGRLVLSQDPNQRDSKQWSFFVYDRYGRLIQEGYFTYDGNSGDHSFFMYQCKKMVITEDWQPLTGYTNTQWLEGFRAIGKTLTKVNYYDTYDFLELSSYADFKSKLAYVAFSGFGQRAQRIVNGVDISTRGMVTGAESMLLDGTGSTVEAYYYDIDGRQIQMRSKNHLEGQGQTKYLYDFTGNLLKQGRIQSSAVHPLPFATEYRYSYDKQGRLTATDQLISGRYQLRIDSLQYNELGQVKRKLIHDAQYSIDYEYDLHGRLKKSISPYFTEALEYETGKDNDINNGKISQRKEHTDYHDETGRYSLLSKYTYDDVNRLVSTTSKSVDIQTLIVKSFRSVYEYDRNGNITQLQRFGLTNNYSTGVPVTSGRLIDDLNMTYRGNRLTHINEKANIPANSEVFGTTDFIHNPSPLYYTQTDEYLYDNNGNLKGDHHKKIAWVQYNSLNLPQKIQMTNGDKTEYIYDASGVKRGARYSIALNSMFIPLGEEQMENKANIRKTVVRDFLEEYELNEYGIPNRIVMPEGYLIGGGANPNQLKRVYQIKDYLGNVRVELEATSSLSFGASPLKVRSTSSYYPFGMEMSLLPQDAANAQPYQVSNNELERTSTNWHDFHHRWYDQQLGRFLSMDPLAEINYSISPYAYCDNDPVNLIDPWGLHTITGGDGSYDSPYDLLGVDIFPQIDDDDDDAGGKGYVDNWYYITVNPFFEGSAPERTVPYYNENEAYYRQKEAEKQRAQWIRDRMAEENITPWEELLETADIMNNEIGGMGEGLASAKGSFSIDGGFRHFKYGKGGYYSKLKVQTYNSVKVGKAMGKGSIAVGVGIGIVNAYNGYKADGNTFGYNAQKATASAVLGIAGAYYGAKAGAVVGFAVGGPMGAIAGGLIGGTAGGIGGSQLGEWIVDQFY